MAEVESALWRRRTDEWSQKAQGKERPEVTVASEEIRKRTLQASALKRKCGRPEQARLATKNRDAKRRRCMISVEPRKKGAEWLGEEFGRS